MRKPRIMLFDIEATDLEASFGYTLCFGYKYLGHKKTHVISLRDVPKPVGAEEPDAALMRRVHHLLTNEADIIVTYYGKGYDRKFLNTRMLLAGLAPLPPLNSEHIDLYFCHVEDHRVLTADLRWVPAGELQVGDRLLAFDEHAPEQFQGRSFRSSIVTNAGRRRVPTYRVCLKDGPEFIATGEHPWLCDNLAKASWLPTHPLGRGGLQVRRSALIRFMEPWRDDQSYDAGWLAGMLDGEGCLFSQPGGYRLSVAQKEGIILDKLRSTLAGRNINFSEATTNGVKALTVRGGWRAVLPLLGSVRPTRLLDKFDPDTLGQMRSPVSKPELFRVAAIEPAGLRDVVTLSTTTATYFTEGFASHNTARGNLKLHSNRLQAVAETLGCPIDKTPVRADTWRRAARGVPTAMTYVIEHCRRDVDILEWCYMKLRPFVRQHPPVGALGVCRACGSKDLQKRGKAVTMSKIPQIRVQCQGCGRWDRRAAIEA